MAMTGLGILLVGVVLWCGMVEMEEMMNFSRRWKWLSVQAMVVQMWLVGVAGRGRSCGCWNWRLCSGINNYVCGGDGADFLVSISVCEVLDYDVVVAVPTFR
ncbi:Hypothetical predicted protein, partial [Olea europaea subsp. europaea]